ncbi:MAG: hypothetical protein PHU62_03030 [Bacteroidales bacterium]|jgi:hypothetical protein|nr:hypothetical protein [Bacteroidales bacterium]MDD3152232.1 hypothetical protein [Bacteroidales bacterium]MDD3913771.1 hypothetical protein [Bacteroidales bacterium]MDD4633536.1 hypothetical protein [Bacteroidales bacterium]
MKEFEVKLYYSGYSTHIVKAKNEEEALNIAKKQEMNTDEVIDSLEPWTDADTVEKI